MELYFRTSWHRHDRVKLCRVLEAEEMQCRKTECGDEKKDFRWNDVKRLTLTCCILCSLAAKGAKAQAARNSKAHQTVRCMRQESSRPYSDRAVPNQSEANTPAVQCNVVNGFGFCIAFHLFFCFRWYKHWRHWHDMMMSAASQAQQKSFSSCGRFARSLASFATDWHDTWYMDDTNWGYLEVWRQTQELIGGCLWSCPERWFSQSACCDCLECKVISASDFRVNPQMDRPCTLGFECSWRSKLCKLCWLFRALV